VEEEPQEEIHLSKGCATVLQRAAPLPAGDVYDGKKSLPREPGLYVIHSGTRAIYVGIAEKSIHGRFQDRYKALRDFGLGPAALAGITVTSYSLGTRVPLCVAGRKKKGRKSLTNINSTEGLLRVLEQHFIKHFKTQRVPPSKFGNAAPERYTADPSVTVSLRIASRDAADPPVQVI